MYALDYERTLTYMLQASEYSMRDFWQWWLSVKDFRRVSERGDLVKTSFGRLLYIAIGAAGFVLAVLSGALAGYSLLSGNPLLVIIAIVLFVLRPYMVTVFGITAVAIGSTWYVQPNLRKNIQEATDIFASHPGVKIAVLGSYGKTTMKELLATVLSEGKVVAATPATKNVAVSHALFAQKLQGNEDIIVVEFGEGKPGDTQLFTDMLQPDYAIVTGLAPAHLDTYGSVEAVAADFAYIRSKVAAKHIFINAHDSGLLAAFPDAKTYTHTGAANWKASNITVAPDGLQFVLTNKSKKIQVKSSLLGRHQVGPLAAVAAIAADLGIATSAIQQGLTKTVPYEHRMQPRKLGGALMIDDTYNGNIEGIKAGIALLKELPAKRRIYVTPGLVGQGNQNAAVHEEIGRLLAAAQFDTIVLMQNSATKYIQSGLAKSGYSGTVTLEDDPLGYYKNLEYHVANGDVIMMQNDLPDRYQ